ncbi:PREDICTED: uncharacterized protein LOC107166386 [Diuraphis noxia]|uniref:uncharacterized protein LOC107166386 n=1 Tax=Diuraphis noxia TaxID=143948 RepID=UPI00076381D0|nr:PREDICTED: uncharacterized protein LOC107166386 [Diuraphis noxia]
MGENKNNSWFKYLESVGDVSSSSAERPEESRIIEILRRKLFPPIEICLISYECKICMKIILEMRIGMHFHKFCLTCVPRINCTQVCQSTLIHSSANSKEHQEKVLKQFRALGGYTIKFIETHKRKYVEDENSE